MAVRGASPTCSCEGGFQPLAGVHDRLELFGDQIGVARFDARLALGELVEPTVAPGFDFSDPGIDLVRLLSLGDGDLVLQAFQRFLAGIFVNKSDHILGEIQHPVQVAPGDIQQQPQIGGDAAGIPDVGNRGG